MTIISILLAEAPLFMASLGVHHEAILPEQWLRTHGRGDRRGLHGLRRVAGWVAGGCWDEKITSDDWGHSRKFPATRKVMRIESWEFR